MLKDEILLSFKRSENEEEIKLDFDTATKNIIIFGGSGSGKTTTICYPALTTLARNGCAGLILDVKGGYSNFGRFINKKIPDKCIILGTKKHCTPINLIAGITPYKLKEFLQETISKDHTDKYWGSNGIEDIVLMYELLISVNKEKSPTLADLYYLFNNNYRLEPLIKKAPIEILDKINNRKNLDGFSIFNSGYIKDKDTKEQQTWQFGIMRYLRPFYEDEYLFHYFCNSESINFENLIYKEEKIIILDLPNGIGETCVFVSQILRAIFKDTVKNQREDVLQQKGYGKEKFTFLLIDEYQQFINKNSSISMDDNNWFDTSRGYGNINIISTQSMDSLISKTNESYTHQLIGNCRNIIHLGTHAQHSLNHIVLIGNKEIAEKLKIQEKEGLGYIYIGQNKKRTTEMGLIVTCQSKLLKTMNHFIKEETQEELRNFINEDLELENNLYKFNYKNESQFNSVENKWIEIEDFEIKYEINKKLYVITSKNESSGFSDFNFIINKKGLIFKEVEVISSIYGDFLDIEFYDEFKFEKDSIVVFVRGGGNFKYCFLEDKNHQKKFKELQKEGIKIGIGYGHITDKFQEINVDYVGITPTDLAYNIYEIYKEKIKEDSLDIFNED